MATETVSLEFSDGTAFLRLNRPGSRNAMNDAMAVEFAEAVETIGQRSDAKALVLTGNGSAFCAGGDLEGFAKWSGAQPTDVEREMCGFYTSFLRVFDLSIPTLAAVNGPAIGAGACLAAACDIRVAAEKASIGFTFVRLGINPGMGAEFLLNRLVGPSRTVELLMTGDVLSAEEAHRTGLFHRVVPGERLLETAGEMARELGRMPPGVPAVIRRNTAAAAEGESLDAILAREARHQGAIFTDPGFQKKIRKIVEKITGESKGKKPTPGSSTQDPE